MQERFEPESKKELYMAALQTRKKKRNEDWAVFGEELKLLAGKAYQDLQDEARERLALNQYLSQLDNPQIAFSVKQAKPKTVDEAIRVTLEMESYLQPTKPSTVAQLSADDGEPGVVAAASAQQRDDPLKVILERMDRLETELRAIQRPTAQKQPRNANGDGQTRSK